MLPVIREYRIIRLFTLARADGAVCHEELADFGVQPFNLALTLGGAMAVAVLERARHLIQELLSKRKSSWDEPDSAGPMRRWLRFN